MTRIERVACYIRVSTDEQKLHGISLDAQRDKLKEYAHKHNLKIVEWYEDEGVSGRKLIRKRPELQRMLNDAKAKKFDRIIFIKLDRFFRSVAEYHECMKIIDPVVWTATEEKYDLTTANGRAFVNMKLTIAELEADQTGERIKIVNDYKVKTGQPVSGKMPWTHKIINTENGKRVVIDPDNRDNAVKVIEYYVRTQSLNRTLTFCQQYHPFCDTKALKSWLSNTLLIGKYRDNNNYCEPLIDSDTFYKIQDKLEKNVKDNERRLAQGTEPLFRQLLRCPECGRILTSSVYSKYYRGKKYSYRKYRCGGNNKNRGCGYKKFQSQNVIERLLIDEIEPYLHNLKYTYSLSPETNEETVNAAVIQAELDRVNYMFEKGRLSVDAYDKKYAELQDKLKEKSQDENELDPSKIKRIEKILDGGWKSVYNSLNNDNKSAFWHSFIKEICIDAEGNNYNIRSITFY